MFRNAFERALLFGRPLNYTEQERLDSLKGRTHYIKRIRKEELRKK